MKKKIVLLLLIIPLLLCSCDNKKDYGLIELSGPEISEYLTREEEKNITFAIYFPSQENSKKFIEDLEKVANRSKEYIYYIDYDHLDLVTNLLLESYLQSFSNTYIAVQSGNIIVNEEYTTYDKLYKSLNGKDYKPNIKYTEEKEKKEYLEKAKSDYEKGLIGSSNSYLNAIWNTKEAKDYYNNNKYYNLLHEWVGYISIDDDTSRYINIGVSNIFNILTVIDDKVDLNNYQKPTNEKIYYYYIKDNTIYISEEEDGKYKPKYEINKLQKDHIYLTFDNVSIGMYANS